MSMGGITIMRKRKQKAIALLTNGEILNGVIPNMKNKPVAKKQIKPNLTEIPTHE